MPSWVWAHSGRSVKVFCTGLPIALFETLQEPPRHPSPAHFSSSFSVTPSGSCLLQGPQMQLFFAQDLFPDLLPHDSPYHRAGPSCPPRCLPYVLPNPQTSAPSSFFCTRVCGPSSSLAVSSKRLSVSSTPQPSYPWWGLLWAQLALLVSSPEKTSPIIASSPSLSAFSLVKPDLLFQERRQQTCHMLTIYRAVPGICCCCPYALRIMHWPNYHNQNNMAR